MGQRPARRWSATDSGFTEPEWSERAPRDAELLRGTRDNAELFGDFFDRYYSEVSEFFWLRTADVEVAADLTAETFAAALAGLERFDGNRGTPAGWLFGIADKQLRQWLRRGRVDRRARDRLHVDPISVDEGGYERVEALSEIRRLVEPLAAAVAALPEAVRRAVELRILDQLEYAAVAQHLGCSQGAARVRVSRGLKQLFEAVVPHADR
ncbi:MAG: RNA polymerase sigma factor [Acidimicrobiales bacterium]